MICFACKQFVNCHICMLWWVIQFHRNVSIVIWNETVCKLCFSYYMEVFLKCEKENLKFSKSINSFQTVNWFFTLVNETMPTHFQSVLYFKRKYNWIWKWIFILERIMVPNFSFKKPWDFQNQTVFWIEAPIPPPKTMFGFRTAAMDDHEHMNHKIGTFQFLLSTKGTYLQPLIFFE